MAEEAVEFIECTSLSIQYDVMGIATVTYTVVANRADLIAYETITAGGITFEGYVANASVNMIPDTSSWYETHVTLIATTN
jgi:hypothetical protein